MEFVDEKFGQQFNAFKKKKSKVKLKDIVWQDKLFTRAVESKSLKVGTSLKFG